MRAEGAPVPSMHWVCERTPTAVTGSTRPVSRAAHRRGIKRLVTWNEVGNAGMRAVNRQMGYVHRMHEMQMLLGYDGPSE